MTFLLQLSPLLPFVPQTSYLEEKVKSSHSQWMIFAVEDRKRSGRIGR